MDSSVIQEFEKTRHEIKVAIAREKYPLKKGMAVLYIAQEKCALEEMTADEIAFVLDKIGVPCDPLSIKRAFARTHDVKVRARKNGEYLNYKLMLAGKQEMERFLTVSGPQVIYFENGKPLSARKQLESIFAELTGTIKICDKYYGERSFSILEMIPKACKVYFMTAQPSGKLPTISSLIRDFKREFSGFEIRKYPNADELHDRYLISDDEIWILGHGIKDIGTRESFIIRLGKNVGEDFIKLIKSNFDSRWKLSQPL